MMEVGWSARRVGHQVGRSNLTVTRCWDQWTEMMSFSGRPGSRRPRQTNSREDRHIIRHACVEPTSLAAVQKQAAPSLRAPVSSRTIARRLAEGHLVTGGPLRGLPMALPLEAFIWSGVAHNGIGLQRNGSRSSSATNLDSI
ncbi:transposable element Tcb2 transposase [Trichonephila clavipes]|nr:transposable element Tcb2 transposase [Trichonephila clavipes]